MSEKTDAMMDELLQQVALAAPIFLSRIATAGRSGELESLSIALRNFSDMRAMLPANAGDVTNMLDNCIAFTASSLRNTMGFSIEEFAMKVQDAAESMNRRTLAREAELEARRREAAKGAVPDQH